jgi:AraC-like DNA-binding protein
MEPIPLISAEHVIRIANCLESSGIPASRYIEQSRISRRVLEDPVGFVPGRSVWTLIGQATRSEGLREFWLDIAELSDWRRAVWVRPMTGAAILGDAIRAMCVSYPRQIPMNRLGLTVHGPLAWFWRRRVTNVRGWEGNEPAEQYTLSFLLEVVRTAAGPGWLPEQLKLESPSSGWSATTSKLPGVRIEHDQPLLALALPVSLLSVPVTITALPAAGAAGEPATDFLGSLRQVLDPWLAGRLVSQELAADLLWTSPRSLRRRLAGEGASWQGFLSDLKFRRAVERLDEGFSVREVAEELGYNHAHHFTRFFRRRAGVPPSEYREEIERARELASYRRPC